MRNIPVSPEQYESMKQDQKVKEQQEREGELRKYVDDLLTKRLTKYFTKRADQGLLNPDFIPGSVRTQINMLRTCLDEKIGQNWGSPVTSADVRQAEFSFPIEMQIIMKEMAIRNNREGAVSPIDQMKAFTVNLQF
jgi:hypothetical protein